eukprot:scaffold84736_cov30-Tisochrysis_lutea.AAC.3
METKCHPRLPAGRGRLVCRGRGAPSLPDCERLFEMEEAVCCVLDAPRGIGLRRPSGQVPHLRDGCG